MVHTEGPSQKMRPMKITNSAHFETESCIEIVNTVSSSCILKWQMVFTV